MTVRGSSHRRRQRATPWRDRLVFLVAVGVVVGWPAWSLYRIATVWDEPAVDVCCTHGPSIYVPAVLPPLFDFLVWAMLLWLIMASMRYCYP